MQRERDSVSFDGARVMARCGATRDNNASVLLCGETFGFALWAICGSSILHLLWQWQNMTTTACVSSKNNILICQLDNVRANQGSWSVAYFALQLYHLWPSSPPPFSSYTVQIDEKDHVFTCCSKKELV